MFQCISVAHVDPAKVEAVLEAAKILAKETRVQHGNLSYNVVQPEGRDDILVITERWETPEDFQGHVANAGVEGDPLNTFAKTMDPSCTAPPEIYPGMVLV